MTRSTRHFRPQAIPTIIVVLLVPLFCGLGLWQLDRAGQKRQLAAHLEARRKLPALSLSDLSPAEPIDNAESEAFRRVTAVGRYLPQKTVLIENRKHLGRIGFHVITPLRLADSERVVLINRGWIPREQLADPQSVPPTPEGEVRVSGDVTLLHPPALALAFEPDTGESLPRWPYLTLDHFARWSGLPTLPFAVLQSPADADGFVRDWPQPQFSDTMHIGYAIQWFAFALIALVIWLRLSLPRSDEREVRA